MSARPKLLYLVAEDWYFHSHRLPMVRAAQRAGFDVAVVTNVKNHRKAIEDEGVRVIPLSLDRRSLNPFGALLCILRVAAVYRREKPALVHHIAMKPVLYGSVAAALAGVPCVVNAFAGLGYVFSAQDRRARVLRPVLLACFRFLLRRKGSCLLFQNADDQALMKRYGLVDDIRATVIPGSGVDLNIWAAGPPPAEGKEIVCAFSGRMIGIKGLETLQEAFKILEKTAPDLRLWLCGAPDPANPGSWSGERLRDWAASCQNVAYKGHCSNMQEVWRQAHIAVQPSWGGEGVPKALLEAAACGRPLVATDVPGCRDVVQDGRNGFLVPPRDAAALAAALARLAAAGPDVRRNMGAESRKIVAERGFSAEAVTDLAEALYRRCVSC